MKFRLVRENFKRVLYFLDDLNIFIAKSKDLGFHEISRKHWSVEECYAVKTLTVFILIWQARSFVKHLDVSDGDVI